MPLRKKSKTDPFPSPKPDALSAANVTVRVQSEPMNAQQEQRFATAVAALLTELVRQQIGRPNNHE